MDLEVGERVITRVIDSVREVLQGREAVIYSIEGPDVNVRMLDDGSLRVFSSRDLALVFEPCVYNGETT
jgi:hypothetical protein